MRITRIKCQGVHVNHRGDWVFVIVETDCGIHGTGELCAGVHYRDRLEILGRLSKDLQGSDPSRIESLVGRTVNDDTDRNTLIAFSAIEQALWDIAGKLAGTPTCELFDSPHRDTVQLYANINRATTDRTPGGFARNAAAAVSDGFDAVKLAPFDDLPFGIDCATDAEAGIACVHEVRVSVGPAVRIMVDCHRRFTVKGALEVADALRALDLYWIEQPVPEFDLDRVATVRNHCGIRLAGGEGFVRPAEFLEVLKRGCLDVIMPDITHVGGIRVLREISKLAADYNTSLSPHGPFGPVCLAASSHAVSSSHQFLMMEYAWGEVSWRHRLILPVEKIHQGRLNLSSRPGLGLELNPKTVDENRIALEHGWS